MAYMLDLPSELLQLIMILLAKSWEGAEDFARMTSVCKQFQEFADDAEILKALCFDNISISNRYGLFQLSNNLLFECANLGNRSSLHLLSKILIVSASQMYSKTLNQRTQPWNNLHIACPTIWEILYEDILANNFLARVQRDKTCSRHSKLVRDFLRRCNPQEILEMGESVGHYVRYFCELETSHHDRLEECIDGMIMFAPDVIAAVEVDLTVIEEMIDEKYLAFEITDDTVEKQALISEIEELNSRVATIFEFGDILKDQDPAIYFEECRRQALLSFGHLFPESV